MFEILGILFFLLLLAYIPYTLRTGKHGAPFVPTEPEVVERVIRLAEVKTGDVFYELGSGDGRLVIAAALRGAKAIGIEMDLLRVLYSRLWIYLLRLNKNAQILYKNFYDVSLKDADVVCLFLLPETNLKLQDKLKKELNKGTRIVSVSFEFPNWQPVRIDPRGNIYGPIYLYVMN